VAPGRGRRTTVDLLGTYLNCPDPVPCIDDPECERPVLPDLEPAPVDICYPSEPFAGRRSVVRIPASAVPTSLTAVPLITATTGAADLRNLTVRLWINSLDIDCTELADVSPCAVCAEVTVAYVPRGSTLRIDGRTQRAVIECPSAAGVSLEAPTLYGPGGGAYEWPDVSCAYGLCLEVTVDASTDAEASVEIQLPVQWESI
jgi:hypothetical protein